MLKYVDFGAAKVIIKGNRTMARTRAMNRGGNDAAGPAVMNSLAGTPMYLAPEVIKGGAGQLGAADIWSMGCCVLEVTTGRKPWSNLDNEWAIMFHIGIATQHPPLPDPTQMSELGIDFITQCLALDPDERPTATELLNHPWLAPMMEFVSCPSGLPDNQNMPETSPTVTLPPGLAPGPLESPVEPSLPSMSDSSSTPTYSPWGTSYATSPLSEMTNAAQPTTPGTQTPGSGAATVSPGTPGETPGSTPGSAPPIPPMKSPLRAAIGPPANDYLSVPREE